MFGDNCEKRFNKTLKKLTCPIFDRCFHFIPPENTRKLFRGYKMGRLARYGLRTIEKIYCIKIK